MGIVTKLIGEYVMVTRRPLPGKVSVLLIPFSGRVGPERWSADSRGRDVVLVMGKDGSRSALLSRLRVVLAHELFHLWVPNALALEGDYDWFFEGFTLYQAMLTALRLHYISFNDYLDTIARVYDSYRSSPERDKLSLIEASERRWTTSASFVYDKGMLVALLYDLKVRRNSGNRTTLTDVYSGLVGEVISNHQDANDLIISMLNRHQGMDQFGRDYIQTAGQLNLAQELEPFGLNVETTGSLTEVKVRRTISSEQRQLLKALGYKK
jgi:predicted metalloprotease with PDZ domain